MFDENKLKALRQQRNLTLKQLAEKAEVSSSQLSLIERGKVVPTLSVFWKICKALEVPVSFFFETMETEDCIVRKDERKKIQLPHSNVQYQLLTANLKGNIEFILVEIDPGEVVDKYQKIVHHGEECGYVQQGQLTILLGDKEYLLNEGDSISFQSSIPHRFINKGNEKSISIWAMSPPSF